MNPQIIKTEKYEEKKGNLNSDNNKLLKEIIVLNKKYFNNIEEYKNKRNKTTKKTTKYKKRINSALLNNIYITFDEERKNKIVKINKYILRRLFAKNMIKKKKIKSLEFTHSDKRILYYNTGKYDMPFVSNIISD